MILLFLIDSQSTLLHSKNLVYRERLKHFKVKYHFLRDKLALGEVSLIYIYIYIGTKMFLVSKFKACLSILHIDNG